MKKYFLGGAIILVMVFVFLNFLRGKPFERVENMLEKDGQQNVVEDENQVLDTPNPASKYCQDNGGQLELVTNKDGSQFGMCNLDDYSCEEWTYFRGECSVEEDSKKIKLALINKGLDLTDMKVVIHKHLGKYIAGGVVSVGVPAGGGYVFAKKSNNGDISIVADGNGAIMCTMLADYPDYPTYLIPECIDETGNMVKR